MLQDIRVDSLKLPWDSWLTWLEGQPLEIPLPRSFFAENKIYRGTAGVFASSGDKLRIPPLRRLSPWV